MDDESYPVDGRGYLLIINFKENCEGSGHDTDGLLNFFKSELGFKCAIAVKNKTESKCIDGLSSVRDSLNDKYYCFICVVIVHGKEDGIHTKDGGRVPIQKLLTMFDNTQMTKFAGKPKWFIINKCHGNKLIQSTKLNLASESAKVTETRENVALEHSDVAIFDSTIQDHLAINEGNIDERFIETCVDVFQNKYKECDIDDMMRIVNRRLHNNVGQTAEIKTRMTRKLFLVKNTSNSTRNDTGHQKLGFFRCPIQ